MNNIPKLICDIKNYEGLYAITKDYQVWSYPKKKGGHLGKRLKPRKNKFGYLYIDLYKDTDKKSHKLHRLIAQALIPNPKNKPCINHIDCNKSNNHPSNLEWVTHKENHIHAGTHNLRNIGINRPCAKLTDKDIPHIRFMLGAGLSLKKIAAWFDVSISTIFSVKHNKTWKHIK